MIYLTSFEIFVCSVKNRYERVTGSNFVEDFGNQAIIELRKNYEAGSSQDDAVRKFMNNNNRLCACCCEAVNVPQG